MLAGLGTFAFSMDDLAFQTLSRRTSWRWAEGKRVGRRDALQFVGPEADDITIAGMLAPGVTGRVGALADLRRLGDDGLAHALVDGSGAVHGAFVITSLGEDQSLHFFDGIPRKADFTLELKRVDDDDARALLQRANATPAADLAESFPGLLWI